MVHDDLDRYTDEQGRSLLSIARRAVAQALGGERHELPAEPWLAAPRACFVTLTSAGVLRGCVGTLRPVRPSLAEEVAGNAVAAALGDRRFPPLAADELLRTRFEVSLLGALAPLAAANESEAVERLPRGAGVLLEWRDFHGTFLPQMWAPLGDAANFLRQLRRKAGLDEGFWDPELRLWTYATRKWAES